MTTSPNVSSILCDENCETANLIYEEKQKVLLGECILICTASLIVLKTFKNHQVVVSFSNIRVHQFIDEFKDISLVFLCEP